MSYNSSYHLDFSAIGSRQRNDSKAELFSFNFRKKSQGKAKSSLQDKKQEKCVTLPSPPLRSSRNSGNNKRKLYEDDMSSDAKSETEAEPFCISSPSKKIKSKNDGEVTSQVSKKPQTQKTTLKSDREGLSRVSRKPQKTLSSTKNDREGTPPASRKLQKATTKNDPIVTSLTSRKPQKTTSKNNVEMTSPMSRRSQKTVPRKDRAKTGTSPVSRKPQKATTKNDIEMTSPASRKPQKATTKSEIEVTSPVSTRSQKATTKYGVEVTSPVSKKLQKATTKNDIEVTSPVSKKSLKAFTNVEVTSPVSKKSQKATTKNDIEVTSPVSKTSQKAATKNDIEVTSPVSKKIQKASTKNNVEVTSPVSKKSQKAFTKNDVEVTSPVSKKSQKTSTVEVTSPVSRKSQKIKPKNLSQLVTSENSPQENTESAAGPKDQVLPHSRKSKRGTTTRTRNRARQIVSSEDEEEAIKVSTNIFSVSSDEDEGNRSETEVQIIQDFGPSPASLPKRIRLARKEKCLAVTVKRLTFDEIAAYANVERKCETIEINEDEVEVPVSRSQNQESLHCANENQTERQEATELTSNSSENLEQLDETLPLYATINVDRQQTTAAASSVGDTTSDSSTDVVGDQDDDSLSSGENRPKATDKQAMEVVATSKESTVVEGETDEDSDSDVEELMQLIISDQPNQYNELRNTDITKNRIGLEKSLTKSHASFVDPNLAKVVEEFPGVKITSADAGDSVRVGYLMLGPKTVRPIDMVTDGRFLYWVIKGRVKVRSCGGYYKKPEEGDKKFLYGRFLTGGACIIVPPYTCYTIENWDNEEALLGYCVIKSTEGDSDTDDDRRR